MFASKDIFLKSSGGYQISRSVRLRSSASGNFQKTFSSAGNQKIWTWSGWVKRGILSADQYIFEGYTSDTNRTFFRFPSDNTFVFSITSSDWLQTTAVFRDPSAWYHIVVAFDSTQSTNTNRVKLYVNGVQQTLSATVGTGWPTLNTNYYINGANSHTIGRWNGGIYLDGYLTEINFIDGQALTPSSFGETNSVTGVWQPKKYTGTYGTNGFYLNFSDNSGVTATTIGKDYSGNGNNWTPNNISVTAGVTYDSMLDVPTPYADGGNGRGNYAVLNPLWVGSGITTSNANLTATASSSANSLALGTIAVSSGKWYWESTIVSGSSMWAGGVVNPSIATPNYTSLTTGNSYAYNNASTSYNGQTGTTYGATYTTNDVIGTALDLDTGAITFYKNGVSQGVAYTGISGTFTPMVLLNTSSISINFGQRPFAYTPPTGFVALNTQNLPTPTISNGAQYMAATTYTGTSASNAVVNTVNGTSFQPDFVWIKNRSGAISHSLYDVVRGAGYRLSSNETTAQLNYTAQMTGFNSNGFSVATNNNEVNESGTSYIGWQWKAGGTAVSNTAGTITSSVSANPTAGFSVVTYTGTAANATVGHGLGVAPSMIITKNRDSATAWWVYHTSLGNTQYLVLNTTAAAVTSSSAWNNTSPTSTVFSLGAANPSNANQDVAYCFAAVAGYSAFGSYAVNNSADGPFVYLGFRARWILFKNNGASTWNWMIVDTARDAINTVNSRLFPDLSNAESSTASPYLDITANGFKIRTTGGLFNTEGPVIYAAFAENPFKYSLAR